MMKQKRFHILFLLLILISSRIMCSEKSGDTISLSRNTTINEALLSIEKITVNTEGKKIYNLSSTNAVIGVPLKDTYWKDALEIICAMHKLKQEEKAGTIIISDLEDAAGQNILSLDRRQVKISASVLEIKKTVSDNIGIDWSTIIDGAVTYTGNLAFLGANAVGSDLFQASGSKTFESGDKTITVNALMAILEENQDGEVLAKPSIFVDSGEKGYIQVGKDFSVKSVDDAGNTIDQFFSAGVILDVTPLIIEDEEGNEAINLKISVERSSVIPGEVSTEITKSKATSSITMYNGEETTIGGLYDKDENLARGGVPILKDLPWWCFGLRYIFGYEIHSVTEKELVIILKAEVQLPILERRDSE